MTSRQDCSHRRRCSGPNHLPCSTACDTLGPRAESQGRRFGSLVIVCRGHRHIREILEPHLDGAAKDRKGPEFFPECGFWGLNRREGGAFPCMKCQPRMNLNDNLSRRSRFGLLAASTHRLWFSYMKPRRVYYRGNDPEQESEVDKECTASDEKLDRMS